MVNYNYYIAKSSRGDKLSERVKKSLRGKKEEKNGTQLEIELHQDLLNTSQMLLPIELLEPIGRGALGKLCIATKPASSTYQ